VQRRVQQREPLLLRQPQQQVRQGARDRGQRQAAAADHLARAQRRQVQPQPQIGPGVAAARQVDIDMGRFGREPAQPQQPGRRAEADDAAGTAAQMRGPGPGEQRWSAAGAARRRRGGQVHPVVHRGPAPLADQDADLVAGQAGLQCLAGEHDPALAAGQDLDGAVR
jgi:hypothetical protein